VDYSLGDHREIVPNLGLFFFLAHHVDIARANFGLSPMLDHIYLRWPTSSDRSAHWPTSLLSRERTAAYIGQGVVKFDEMVKDGRMPKPLRIDRRTVWDVRKLDAAIDELANQGDGDGKMTSTETCRSPVAVCCLWEPRQPPVDLGSERAMGPPWSTREFFRAPAAPPPAAGRRAAKSGTWSWSAPRK